MRALTIQKINYLVLVMCFALSIFAMAFYWSQYWIQFTPNAIPWLFYPLFPYIIIGALGYAINKNKNHKPTAIILLLGSLVLLGLTSWFYIPFLESSLIFYLRMSLGMSAIWLSAISVIFVVIAFITSLWAKNV